MPSGSSFGKELLKNNNDNQLYTADLSSSEKKCRGSKNTAYLGDKLCTSKPCTLKVV